MNEQLNEIKDHLLLAQGAMIIAAQKYDTDRRGALQNLIQVEAKLNQARAKVTQFLETDHFSQN